MSMGMMAILPFICEGWDCGYLRVVPLLDPLSGRYRETAGTAAGVGHPSEMRAGALPGKKRPVI
jgi:hypothetical protein